MKNAIWVAAFVVLVAVFVGIGVLRKGGTKAERRIGVIPKETESVYWEGVRQGALKAGAEENSMRFSGTARRSRPTASGRSRSWRT